MSNTTTAFHGKCANLVQTLVSCPGGFLPNSGRFFGEVWVIHHEDAKARRWEQPQQQPSPYAPSCLRVFVVNLPSPSPIYAANFHERTRVPFARVRILSSVLFVKSVVKNLHIEPAFIPRALSQSHAPRNTGPQNFHKTSRGPKGFEHPTSNIQ